MGYSFAKQDLEQQYMKYIVLMKLSLRLIHACKVHVSFTGYLIP